MKARIASALILSLLGVVAAMALAPSIVQGQDDDISSPKLRISYDAFKKLYDAKKIVVIDTRDAASFAMGHIPGSRLIPLDEIANHVDELRKLHRPIVTYCS